MAGKISTEVIIDWRGRRILKDVKRIKMRFNNNWCKNTNFMHIKAFYDTDTPAQLDRLLPGRWEFQFNNIETMSEKVPTRLNRTERRDQITD